MQPDRKDFNPGHYIFRFYARHLERFNQFRVRLHSHLPVPRHLPGGTEVSSVAQPGFKPGKLQTREPELMSQIKFSEWTRDKKLRQPVFLGLRDDKDAAAVVREQPN